MKLTKYLKVDLKNRNRTLGAATLDENKNIVEAIKQRKWENALNLSIESESKSVLALFFTAHAILKAWPWLSLRSVDDDNVFELEFDKSKVNSFNDLMQKNKIKKEIEATIVDPESVVEDISEDESLKGKAGKLMKNINVESVTL